MKKQNLTKQEIKQAIKLARSEIKEWQKFIKNCEKYLKDNNLRWE